MNIFEQICNDQEIIERYLNVEKNEIINKGWAYHNMNHVLNVTEMVEKILSSLKYNRSFIEEAKIAALLHDTGAIEGKEGHAHRSYLFVKDYLQRNNMELQHEKDVLEAIDIHSDGFDTDNVIALAIILSDKLDVKKNRITEVGATIEGNRQYTHIDDIIIDIVDGKMIINFIVDDNFDREEVEEFYFTPKIFKSIKAFSNKFDLIPEVMINDNRWEKFYNE